MSIMLKGRSFTIFLSICNNHGDIILPHLTCILPFQTPHWRVVEPRRPGGLDSDVSEPTRRQSHIATHSQLVELGQLETKKQLLDQGQSGDLLPLIFSEWQSRDGRH